MVLSEDAENQFERQGFKHRCFEKNQKRTSIVDSISKMVHFWAHPVLYPTGCVLSQAKIYQESQV